ncbi:hypothetical protein D3C86_1739120 [compost metagenome]
MLTLSITGTSTISGTIGDLSTVTSLCIERAGTTFTVYANGAAVISYTTSDSLPYTTLRMMNSIVNSAQWTTQGSPGLLDELRLTIGVARYQGNYTPSTAPFPEV